MESAALYRLMAWLSPAYPTGGFSYSHGLEYAVEAGLVSSRSELVDWVGHIVTEGAGRVDAMLFRAAYEAADDPATLDDVADLAAAFRGTAETALESSQQGAAFLATTRLAWPDPRLDAFALRRGRDPVALPVAVALACAGRVPLGSALLAYLEVFAANLVSAGVRLIRRRGSVICHQAQRQLPRQFRTPAGNPAGSRGSHGSRRNTACDERPAPGPGARALAPLPRVLRAGQVERSGKRTRGHRDAG